MLLVRGYRVVRDGEVGELLLLSNGVARKIDAESTTFFGVINASTVAKVDHGVLRQFRRGRAVGLIQRKDMTPDENHRLALLRIDAQQDRIIKKIDFLSPGVKNPSFAFWGGRQLMVSQHIHLTPSVLYFSWLNLSYYPQNFERLPGLGALSLDGIDQRIMVVNDSLVVVLYCLSRAHRFDMAYAELRVGAGPGGNVTLRSREVIFHPSLTYWPNRGWEKNWGSFLFRNASSSKDEVFLIETINPLRILQLDESITSGINPSSQVVVRVVSEAPTLVLSDWEWGELRGGSNAILVGDVYLALFHTRPKIHNSDLITYFWGGYQFSSQPPFRLLAISNVPVVDDRFYNGPWTNRRFAYAPYPTGLTLEGDDLKIVLGYNDNEGYILTVPLQRMLDSLVPAE